MRIIKDSELATILHCIRFYQEFQTSQYGDCRLGCCDHFDDADELTLAKLDELAESLNLDKVALLDAEEAQEEAEAQEEEACDCGECDECIEHQQGLEEDAATDLELNKEAFGE
jgi:hypothetical protein